jgi:predicted secreted protein
MNFLPILLIGAAVMLGSKRRRRTASRKALPDTRGEVIVGDSEDRPDVILHRVGERFSIAFSTSSSREQRWILKASPPDNSIAYVRTDHIATGQSQRGFTGPDGKDVFVFDAVRPGKGSLVFHWQAPHLDGSSAPTEVVEFVTEVS